LIREKLREMAIFLTDYVGFPLGSKLDGVIKRVAAKRKKAAAEGTANDKKANVNAAVKMHTGTVTD
jgi:4-carboxymuconolactone decarboxylase